MVTNRRRGKRQTGSATVAAAMVGRDMPGEGLRAEVREAGTGRAATTSLAPLTTAAPEGREVEKGDGAQEAGGAGEAAIGEAAAIEVAVAAAPAGTHTADSTSCPLRQGTLLLLLHPSWVQNKFILDEWKING